MTPLVKKYCKKCFHASWNDNSVVVCDHIDVLEACNKISLDNQSEIEITDDPPPVHEAIEICRGEYFDETDRFEFS